MTHAGGDDPVVHLRLTCLQPPEVCAAEPAEFGLQDRAGNVHPGQIQPDGAVLYELAVPVTCREDNVARLRGPYVQGTPAAPFLYLSAKRLEPGTAEGPWIRRLKIPLPILTCDEVVAARDAAVFAARISGTHSGTVPLLDGGWAVQDAGRA